MNLDYGAVAQNRKVSVAFADERVLAPIRDEWWRLWTSERAMRAPYVYESDRVAHVGTDLATLADSDEPTMLLGQRISVAGELMAIPLTDDPGRNLAIIGAEDRERRPAVGMLQACALSCALSSGGARILLCDLRAKDGVGVFGDEAFTAALGRIGTFEIVPRDEFESILKGLAEAAVADRVYVIAANMDGWMPTDVGFGDNALKALAKQGPTRGVHLVCWWVREANFQSHMGLSNDDPFNAKVFLRVDEREIQQHIGIGATWTARGNRALATDRVELSENVTFAPYVPVGPDDVSSVGTGA